jgi:hypothetical protein
MNMKRFSCASFLMLGMMAINVTAHAKMYRALCTGQVAYTNSHINVLVIQTYGKDSGIIKSMVLRKAQDEESYNRKKLIEDLRHNGYKAWTFRPPTCKWEK